MTLGFHYHSPADMINGKMMLPGYLGVFIDGLAEKFDTVICFMHSPTAEKRDMLDYEIKSSNVELVDIGTHKSMFNRAFNGRHHVSKIESHYPKIDGMLIRGPSPLLPFVASSCRRHDVSCAYLLVGDYLEGLRSSRINMAKRVLLWTFYSLNKLFQDYRLDHTLVFVNSGKLYDEYSLKSHCIEVRTTTLHQEDFFSRSDTCRNDVLQLLYTGRIDPGKGIEDMLYALKSVHQEGHKAVLNIVGWETSKGFIERLKTLAKELHVSNDMIFHGKKRVGIELFTMYRNADIYLLASRGDFEGFPRTLWEAMANSMPIVATKVGAIPYFLTDEKTALLVKPNDTDALAGAVLRLAGSKELRVKLISQGYALAQTNTLEVQSEVMHRHLVAFFEKKK